jgi:pimeloyl-ACP methyl ester carboxylesterase
MKIVQKPGAGRAGILRSQSAHSFIAHHFPEPPLPFTFHASRFTHHVSRFTPHVSLCLALAALLLAGCVAPIGADRVSTRLAYDQVDANALRTGKSSAATASLLHRYELGPLAARHPDQAVRLLHQKALDTGERDLLFALAELSYVAGEDIRHSVTPWDQRDARDYYLGSAVYAWLYLFGEGKDPQPTAYQRRFREACDFYNYGLGLALLEGRRSTNAIVQLESGLRRLPVGAIQVSLSPTGFASKLASFDQILLADKFRVRGLSARNRDAGVGTPLICVGPFNPEVEVRLSAPATLLLRAPGSLAELAAGRSACALEVYSSLDNATVAIGSAQVPLENDLTTYRAYTLNQAFIWSLGMMQFLSPGEHVRSQLILSQPYVPGRIPVVFVHGTFSSPVTWAEMINSLTADPELRRRYQLWNYVYSSGNPLPISVGELRDALTAMVQKLDPEGKDPALRQMVIIGHSQGGLLTHCAAIDTGDRIWNALRTERFEDVKMSEAERERLRHMLFLEPLPFVSRVVFISTPHRGSYLAGGFARRWARRLMSLPGDVAARGRETIQLAKGSSMEKFFHGRMPTSLDSMSPKNPLLPILAEIPVAPGVKAHSIIAVQGDGDYHKGRDGIVAYQSAHVDYVESEFIVRSYHSCLNQPATIEEVRRILHEHLDQSVK